MFSSERKRERDHWWESLIYADAHFISLIGRDSSPPSCRRNINHRYVSAVTQVILKSVVGITGLTIWSFYFHAFGEWTCSSPGRARIEGLRNAETFALKVSPPEILALLIENSNISAFVSIVPSAGPPFCYRISGCGFALRNGLCVRVNCIHLFHWVAWEMVCACALGWGRGETGREDIYLRFLLPTMTQGFHFNKEFLSWQRRKADGLSLSAQCVLAPRNCGGQGCGEREVNSCCEEQRAPGMAAMCTQWWPFLIPAPSPSSQDL